MATNVLVCRVSTFRAVRKPIVIAITGVTILLSGCGGGASQSELAQARQDGANAQAQKESIGAQQPETTASVPASTPDQEISAEPVAPSPAQLLAVGESVDAGQAARVTLKVRQSASGNPNYFVVIEALQDNIGCPGLEELYATSAGERLDKLYQPKFGCDALNQGEHSTSNVIGTSLNGYRFPDIKLVFAPGGEVIARWSIPN